MMNFLIKNIAIYYLLLVGIFNVCLAMGVQVGYKNNPTLYVNFKESDEVTLNPDMGMFVSGWNHHKKLDLPSFSNIVYQRFSWQELEPEEGIYNFTALKNFIGYWRDQGVRVGFRVMSSSIGMGTMTPGYVFESGVPRVRHKPMKQERWHTHDEQDDPVYWHPIYLEKYSKFVKAMGEAIDGGNGVEFIDIGGVGVYGEMHLATFVKGMWTKKELEEHGFSHQSYFNAYKKMIEMHKNVFKNTKIFLNISRYEDIAEYAALHGVGLRFDGLSVGRNQYTRAIVSSLFNKYCNRVIQGHEPVACMYEFASSNQDVAISALNNIIKEPVSYLHLNLGNSSRWSESLVAAILSASKRLGYRLVPEEISLPSSIRLDEDLKISQRWVNVGVAPIHKDLNIVFSISDSCKHEIIRIVLTHKIPSSTWLPMKQVINENRIKLPVALPDGVYSLRFGLIDIDYPKYGYRLGVNGRDNDGLYGLAKMVIANRVAYFSSDAKVALVNDNELHDIEMQNSCR